MQFVQAMRAKFEEKQRQFDELAKQKFESVPSHGFGGGDDARGSISVPTSGRVSMGPMHIPLVRG